MIYRKFVKRSIDILGAFLGVVVLSPVFLLVGGLLFFQNNGDVLFRQERPGLNQKPFFILKFKTMTDGRDKEGGLLPDTLRITKFGKFVRRMSLDELPQLINVLKGDMSLVGPRPLLQEYISLYSPVQLRRHEVRPGMTGWAQVNGRNSISWTRKFAYDVEYVDRLAFSLDVYIVFLTFVKILKQDGIEHSPECPMPPFNGIN